MSIPAKILKHLESNNIKFEIIPHRKVFTAFDAAQTLKREVKQIAKNLVIKTNQGFIMAILPASKNLDLKKLKDLIAKNTEAKISKVSFPKEKVISKEFKVKEGAMPAFGAPFKIQVFLDNTLAKEKKVIFSSGSYVESFEMAVTEYIKLENPVLGSFSAPKKLPKMQKKKLKKKKKSTSKRKPKKNLGKSKTKKSQRKSPKNVRKAARKKAKKK